jgi:hypothetical protein
MAEACCFDERLSAPARQHIRDYGVVFGSIRCPVHEHAVRFRFGPEHFQIRVELGQRVPLNGGGERASPPIRECSTSRGRDAAVTSIAARRLILINNVLVEQGIMCVASTSLLLG